MTKASFLTLERKVEQNHGVTLQQEGESESAAQVWRKAIYFKYWKDQPMNFGQQTCQLLGFRVTMNQFITHVFSKSGKQPVFGTELLHSTSWRYSLASCSFHCFEESRTRRQTHCGTGLSKVQTMAKIGLPSRGMSMIPPWVQILALHPGRSLTALKRTNTSGCCKLDTIQVITTISQSVE
jgi:hypothetical protein